MHFPLTIPAASIATRTITTARALYPRPRPRAPVKAPRRTSISAWGCTYTVTPQSMMTRSYRDWVRRWRRHSSTEWPRGTGQLLHKKTGLDRSRNGVAQMSRFRLIIGIRQQFGASKAVNTRWQLGTWMRRKTISIILQRDAKRKSINLSC